MRPKTDRSTWILALSATCAVVMIFGCSASKQRSPESDPAPQDDSSVPMPKCPDVDSQLPAGCLDQLCECAPSSMSACGKACWAMVDCAASRCPDGQVGCDECPHTFSTDRDKASALTRCLSGTPECHGTRVAPWAGLCGNEILDMGEDCDGTLIGDASCDDLDLTGDVACRPDCTLDTSPCQARGWLCGDGVAKGAEPCDGADLLEKDCTDFGFADGAITCTDGCEVDTSACDACGNGRLNTGERCDDMRLAGQSCVSLGFIGGTLACGTDCAFDTSGCAVCGNGIVEAGETCDGSELGGQSCDSLGLGTGELACSPNTCTFDTSACMTGPACGNGIVELGEQCDGTTLAGQDCAGLGFAGGTLACNTANCRYNTSACISDPGPSCADECVKDQCSEALAACDGAFGCTEAGDCLDGCRQNPSSNCALSCSNNIDAIALATIAADCVSDCTLGCR